MITFKHLTFNMLVTLSECCNRCMSRSRNSKAWTRSSSEGSQIPLNYVREHFQADGKGFNLCVGICAHSNPFPWHWDDPGELCPTGGQVTQGRTPQTTAQPFKIFIFWRNMRMCPGDWEFICLRTWKWDVYTNPACFYINGRQNRASHTKQEMFYLQPTLKVKSIWYLH